MTLILFPNSLSGAIQKEDISLSMQQRMEKIDGLIAESEKEARQFLKSFSFDRGRTFRDISLAMLNEHIPFNPSLLEPLLKGETWGLISDRGLPCIADPGSELVCNAREKGISIEVIPGPCSILQALLLSGFPAQSFAFHGYFPIDELPLRKKLQSIKTGQESMTHIFIETPYRSLKRLKELLTTFPDHMHLCIVWDLMMPTQGVLSYPLARWKNAPLPDVHKKPCVFLIKN